jgi:putative ATPase
MARERENLFSRGEREQLAQHAPLAVRLRPATLDDFVGQLHFAGEGKLLRRMIEAGNITSLIFYGPPGTGKTTLARIVAGSIKAKFHYLSAPAASVKDVREIIAEAKDRLITSGTKTLLFIDEIHRFNRAQQDVLLDDVENGIITLIGATTENPFFSVNSPLISRSTVFAFEALGKDDILTVLNRALADSDKGLGQMNIEADPKALDFLAEICDGDARKALTALEVAILSQAHGKSAAAHLSSEARRAKGEAHSTSPRNPSSVRRFSTTARAIRTMTLPVPCRSPCAVPTRTRRSTGWPG